jgi:hypothetical protein
LQANYSWEFSQDIQSAFINRQDLFQHLMTQKIPENLEYNRFKLYRPWIILGEHILLTYLHLKLQQQASL